MLSQHWNEYVVAQRRVLEYRRDQVIFEKVAAIAKVFELDHRVPNVADQRNPAWLVPKLHLGTHLPAKLSLATIFVPKCNLHWFPSSCLGTHFYAKLLLCIILKHELSC